jgi:hypothetical protein
MTTEQRALMNVLCERIQGEQDPKRFLALLEDVRYVLDCVRHALGSTLLRKEWSLLQAIGEVRRCTSG